MQYLIWLDPAVGRGRNPLKVIMRSNDKLSVDTSIVNVGYDTDNCAVWWDNIPILSKHILKYLGIKGHFVCNSPRNSSENKIMYVCVNKYIYMCVQRNSLIAYFGGKNV